MNPIVVEALGAILRWLLTLGAGYLVKAGIWTGSAAETYVAAAAMGLLTLGWSLWQKYKTRSRLLTALWMPHGTTEAQLDVHIGGGGQTPSVTTPADTVPGVPKLPGTPTLPGVPSVPN